MILKSFTKKGYWYGREYLVFKSYGNKVQGVLQSPALEDSEGYVVHFCYTMTLDPREQLKELVTRFKLISMRACSSFRVFNEEGIPYEAV